MLPVIVSKCDVALIHLQQKEERNGCKYVKNDEGSPQAGALLAKIGHGQRRNWSDLDALIRKFIRGPIDGNEHHQADDGSHGAEFEAKREKLPGLLVRPRRPRGQKKANANNGSSGNYTIIP